MDELFIRQTIETLAFLLDPFPWKRLHLILGAHALCRLLHPKFPHTAKLVQSLCRIRKRARQPQYRFGEFSANLLFPIQTATGPLSVALRWIPASSQGQPLVPGSRREYTKTVFHMPIPSPSDFAAILNNPSHDHCRFRRLSPVYCFFACFSNGRRKETHKHTHLGLIVCRDCSLRNCPF